MKKGIFCVLTLLALVFSSTIIFNNTSMVLAEGESNLQYVAQIGEQGYNSLSEAITVANESTDPVVINLLQDTTLGELLTINKHVTITGAYTIKRATDLPETTSVNEDYKGMLFKVSAEATLVLDGGVIIDGGNDWIFKEDDFFNAVEDTKLFYKTYGDPNSPEYDPDKKPTLYSGLAFVTTNGVTSSDHMINVFGNMIVNHATIKNHLANVGAINLNTGSSLTLNKNALLIHNGANGSGAVIKMTGTAKCIMNDGAEISGNYFSGNGGCILIVNGGNFTMNGGLITNNCGVNSNGSVMMLYQSHPIFTMVGGEISGNISLPGSGAGLCSAIYLHNSGEMIMKGGIICNNEGYKYAGIVVQKGATGLSITDGNVVENVSWAKGENDVAGNPSKVTITGGTYTQDVSKYVAKEYISTTNQETGMVVVSKCPHNFVDSKCIVCEYECMHPGAPEDKPATCITPAYCSICDINYGETLEHNYTYVVNEEENTINKSCDRGCGHDQTIKLEAPENLSYTENSIEATVNGLVDETIEIIYNTADQKAPIDPGDYVATITWNGYSVSEEFTVVEATPVVTITSSISEVIKPGETLVVDVVVNNPNNPNAQYLPTDFVLKYKIGDDQTWYKSTGLKLTLPEDIELDQKLVVFVESIAIDGKYTSAVSNVLEFTIEETNIVPIIISISLLLLLILLIILWYIYRRNKRKRLERK